MADGDEVHPNLPRRYLNSYKDLCAPNFNPEDTAHDVTRVVRNDVRNLGNPPVEFILHYIEDLSNSLPREPLLRQAVDYGVLQQQVDRVARQHYGNEQGMELAKRAIRGVIENYRQGGNYPNAENVLGNYLMNIHEARFSERVPLTTSHLNGLSAVDIGNRLNVMRSFSEMEYSYLARSLVRDPNVNRRMPRRRYNQGLGLYDEVH